MEKEQQRYLEAEIEKISKEMKKLIDSASKETSRLMQCFEAEAKARTHSKSRPVQKEKTY